MQISRSTEELISFGDEMGSDDSEISEWRAICIDKINEAYDEYMHKKIKGK